MTRGPLRTLPAFKHPEEAHRSWWTTAPRVGFTAQAEAEQPRMARSTGAQRVSGVLVLAWKVSGRRS